MKAASAQREGVFGAELWIEVGTGRLCHDEGKCPPPLGQLTNAFLVWIGRTILVVSPGVAPDDAPRVATRLRDELRLAELAIVFQQGWDPASALSRIYVNDPSRTPGRELARAEAYVLVQCGWVESKDITVDVSGELFVVRAEMEPDRSGGFYPVVS